jgi:hypothetical protein
MQKIRDCEIKKGKHINKKEVVPKPGKRPINIPAIIPKKEAIT